MNEITKIQYVLNGSVFKKTVVMFCSEAAKIKGSVNDQSLSDSEQVMGGTSLLEIDQGPLAL